MTSTLLTLSVVPVVFTFFDDLSAWLARKRGGESASAAASHRAPDPAAASGD